MDNPSYNLVLTYDAAADKFVNPTVGPLYSPPVIILPRDYCAIVLQILKQTPASVDGNGISDNGVGLDISDFDLNPVFGLKSDDHWKANASAFDDSASGRSPSHSLFNLASGCDVIPYLSNSLTAPGDYRGQFEEISSHGYTRRIPRDPGNALLFRLPQNLVIGNEPGSLPSDWIGNASITEGNDHVDVEITGLTLATGEVMVNQKAPTGNIGGTNWWTEIIDGSPKGILRIWSNANAGTGIAFNFYYEVRHL